MPTPTIYFVRHGETDWNAEQRFQGQKDIPINANGRKQAARNGQTLKGLLKKPADFDYVSSPLGRACETMEIIRQTLGLPARGYSIDGRLKEVSYGEWEGLTTQEIKASTPGKRRERKAKKYSFVTPGGESYEMLLERVNAWLPYVELDSVVTCHGGIIRVLMHHLGGIDAEEAVNSTVPQDRIFRWDGGKTEWLG